MCSADHTSRLLATRLSHNEVDIGDVGEGENTMIELAKAIENGKDLTSVAYIINLLNAQKKALRSYYLRPSQIIKQALKMRSFNDLKTNIGYAKVLLFSFKDIYRG